MKSEMDLAIIGQNLSRLFLLLLLAVFLITACGTEELIAEKPQLLPTMAPNMDFATRFEPTVTPAAAETIPIVLVPSAAATTPPTATPSPMPTNSAAPTTTATHAHPLDINFMREVDYPGSPLTIEQKLSPGSNFDRFVASYLSEGNRIYALLTVPKGKMPPAGWPAIIFNHGYIPPDVYRTTKHYVDYVDSLARNSFIVFKPDYRGHGESEGQPTGAYGSPGYTIDVLNGLAAVKNLPGLDPDRIGMMGHSMGGYITLRAMVVSEEIKAGVIWGGVVASYEDLLNNWGQRAGQGPTPTPNPTQTNGRPNMIDIYGPPEENPEFWAAISSNTYLTHLSGPIQLHHSSSDATVPVEFSQKLYNQILETGEAAELFLYKGDNHNLHANFGTAMRRSIVFFDAYLQSDE